MARTSPGIIRAGLGAAALWVWLGATPASAADQPADQPADQAPVDAAPTDVASGGGAAAGESAEQAAFMAKLRALQWVEGPKSLPILDNSQLALPDAYVFLDKAETDKFLKLNENLASGTEVLVAPRNLGWSAYLSFDDEGYVKDNEAIDAKALLDTLKQNAQAGNEQRKSLGYPPLAVLDWAVPPAYNNETKRLEWATIVESEGHRSVNFFTKILGRKGYTTVVLVSAVPDLPAARVELNQLLQGYVFNSGEQYADYKPGDKVAAYGLAALVLGGAAALATKKGFWAVIASALAASWKFIAVAVAAAGASLRKLFGKKAG